MRTSAFSILRTTVHVSHRSGVLDFEERAMSHRLSDILVAVDSNSHLDRSPGDLERWAEEARRGDATSEDLLFREARSRLLRIALGTGIGPDSAADMVQETLLSVHANLHRFDPGKGSFEGWLAVSLLRRVRNRRRASGRLRRMLGAVRLHVSGSTVGGQRAAEARLTLRRLLRELTARQREVIALYEIGGMQAGEVGNALEITPAAVRSIARDARRRLTEAARRLGMVQEVLP
jgi:RNA polymerase sigma factor (sigma-70 family)